MVVKTPDCDEGRLDAVLVFAPPYVYSERQPGIGAIAGYAKKEGLKTLTIDANINGLEYVLKEVDRSAAERAISVLTDERSYLPENFEAFRGAKDAIEELSLRASRSSGEEFQLRRNTVAYIPKHDAQSRRGLLDGMANREDCLFYGYFDRELLPQLEALHRERAFRLVGIAITDRKQAIPGFIISDMIKERIPGVRVAVGGNYISRSRDILKLDDETNRELFAHTDYMLYLEADRAFSKLIKAVVRNGSVAGIEKLIRMEDGKVVHSGLDSILSLDGLPLPDYTGLRSWTPEAVPAYNFQRGCNYGRCNFCGLMDGYDSYSMRTGENPLAFVGRRKSTGAIISDLRELGREHRFLNLTDETFFASDQIRMSRLFAENGIDIKWTSYDRVEKEFEDPENCRTVARGGSAFKQFGVESASVKSLESMSKGVRGTDVYRVLRNTHDAGIMNHVFLLVGYPGETLGEALLLFPFLEKVKDCTFTVKPTWYKLSRGSPDSLMAGLKGIRRLYTEGDLAPNLHFESTEGMSKKTAEAVTELLQGWINRHHVINYVAGTYCYSQRFFIGYDGILNVVSRINSGEIGRPAAFTPGGPPTNRERRALNKVWGELVGRTFAKVSAKYANGNRDPGLVRAYEGLMRENPVAGEFPSGFSSIEDVARISGRLKGALAAPA